MIFNILPEGYVARWKERKGEKRRGKEEGKEKGGKGERRRGGGKEKVRASEIKDLGMCIFTKNETFKKNKSPKTDKYL